MSGCFRFTGLLTGAAMILLANVGAVSSMIAQEEMRALRSESAATGPCLSAALLGTFNFVLAAFVLAWAARKSGSAKARIVYWGGVVMALLLAGVVAMSVEANSHMYHIATVVFSGAIATGLLSFLGLWLLWKRRQERQRQP